MLFAAAIVAGVLTSCSNSDSEFDDFGTISTYFSYQTPVRTIELGNDPEWDVTNDNNHRCVIQATMGGSYGNKQDVVLDYMIDPSLCDNLYFSDGITKVKPLPESYYRLADDKLRINKGQILGGVTVEFTDDFFNDPLSLSANYVIPIRITGIVQGADEIVSGKDYTLFAVKYINPWHAHYLRRGTDKVTVDGVTTLVERKQQYVENDEQVVITTKAYLENEFPVTYKDEKGESYVVNLKLSFNDNGECTVSSNTEGVSASGSGRYVTNGEKNSFGGKDRDALYLDYKVEMPARNTVYETSDVLVMHYRGVKAELFSTISK